MLSRRMAQYTRGRMAILEGTATRMANLLVLVLDEPDKFPAIIQAWERIGVPGVTMLDSVGSRQLRTEARRDDLPLMPSMRAVLASMEEHNRTIFTVIEDDTVLERAVEEARSIVGDFMNPHTGILFVVPVSKAWGVPKARRRDRPKLINFSKSR